MSDMDVQKILENLKSKCYHYLRWSQSDMSTDSNRQRSRILLPLPSRTARFASGVRCLRGVKFTIWIISRKRVLVTCHTYLLSAVQLLLPLNFSKILRLELSEILCEELQIEQKKTVMANNKKDTKCS